MNHITQSPNQNRPATNGHVIPRARLQRIGLILGFVGFVIIAFVPTPETLLHHAAGFLSLPTDNPSVQEVAGGMQKTLAILFIMILWWLTEAVPIPITALLPGLLLPLLHVTGFAGGQLFPFEAGAALAPYARPIIYLFLAGFLLAGAMRKTGLDRRITLTILSWKPVMRGPGTILLVVMGITATLSMWISNTATAALMLPIAVMILDQLGQHPSTGEKSPFGIAMMFGIAWAASIGGLGTIIGSPPNAIVVGILQHQGIATVDFLQWIEIGMPIAFIGLIAAWALLMLRYRPKIGSTAASLQAIRRIRSQLGPPQRQEKATLLIFLLAVSLWISQPFWSHFLPEVLFHRLDRFGTSEIGLFCALLLFVIPIDWRSWRAILTWRDAKYVDWGILILFGGGIALSDAMLKTGVADWIAKSFVGWIGRPGPWLCLVLLVFMVDFLTEITSNTAVTSMMTPVLLGLALPLGLPPLTLCIACAMASSLAFMLPVATPPNALVYASGYFRVGDMVRAGFMMNLLGCLVLVTGLYFIAGRLLNVIPIP